MLPCLSVPSLTFTAPAEPLLGSLLSKDQNVEPELPAPGTQEGHSREDDIDDWDYEVDVTDIPILNPDWDPSMENPEDPNFSELIFFSISISPYCFLFDHDIFADFLLDMPFGDLMKMMEAPLATTNQGVLQEMTTATEPAMTETTPSLLVGGTSAFKACRPLSIFPSSQLPYSYVHMLCILFCSHPRPRQSLARVGFHCIR